MWCAASFKASSCSTLVALIGSLSTNEAAEDAIQGGHPDTDARQNDLGLILLGLSVPWDQLSRKFHAHNATISSFLNFTWQSWLEATETLDEYALYCADNILQMRKSQIESKLDQEQRRAAKNQAMEMSVRELLEENETGQADEAEESEIDEYLGLPNAHTLLNAVDITRHRWREMDAANSRGVSVLSHMQHSLQRADDEGTSQSDLRYDLNPSGVETNICSYLDVSTNFSQITTDLWKKVQNSANAQQGEYDAEDRTNDFSDHVEASIHRTSICFRGIGACNKSFHFIRTDRHGSQLRSLTA